MYKIYCKKKTTDERRVATPSKRSTSFGSCHNIFFGSFGHEASRIAQFLLKTMMLSGRILKMTSLYIRSFVVCSPIFDSNTTSFVLCDVVSETQENYKRMCFFPTQRVSEELKNSRIKKSIG